MLLKDVLAGVENYRLSVEHAADTTLARRVWANEPDVSLITPRGHARGYDEIENMFYIKAMAGLFSTRTLRITVGPDVRIFGDTAVVEFYWDFVATRRADGTQHHTRGRESHVWRQFSDGPRLVHVHYSQMPAGD